MGKHMMVSEISGLITGCFAVEIFGIKDKFLRMIDMYFLKYQMNKDSLRCKMNDEWTLAGFMIRRTKNEYNLFSDPIRI